MYNFNYRYSVGFLLSITCFFVVPGFIFSNDSTSSNLLSINNKQSFTIEKVEEIALKNNWVYKTLKEAVEQKRYLRHQATALALPSIATSLSAQRTPTTTGYGDFYRTALKFTQTLYSSDVLYGIKLAKLDHHILLQDLEIFRQSLIFEVRRAYYNIILGQEDVQFQQENIALLKEVLESEEHKFQVGELTKFHVNQSKVAVTSALATYYQSVKKLKLAENTLLDLMGMEPEKLVLLNQEKNKEKEAGFPVFKIAFLSRMVKKLDTFEPFQKTEKDSSSGAIKITFNKNTVFESQDFYDWEQKALENRPDLAKQLLLIKQANKSVHSKISKYLPTASFQAEHVDQSPGSIGISRPKSFWNMILQLDWTLFDGLGRESAVKQSRSALKGVLFTYKEALQKAKVDVHNRLHEIEEALLMYLSAREGVDLADQAMQQALDRFRVGVISSLEYRDAVTSLLEAKQNFNSANFQLLVSYYALKRDVGLIDEEKI